MEQSPNSPRRIGAAAKAVFLAALTRGATREDAAAEAGFSLTGFYGQRRRDPAFAADWAAALATAPAAERRAKAYEERGEVRIAPANRRFAQRRRRRHVRFTAERRADFLVHFEATGDKKAAAAAAGICPSTVSRHCRIDPGFAALFRETLDASHLRLEAEALHIALMTQARLRHALETAAANARPACPAACPTCGHRPGEAETFERAMRLLAVHDRKERRAERGFKPGGRRQKWTFERSIAALEKWMIAMGVPILTENEIAAALRARRDQAAARPGRDDRNAEGGGKGTGDRTAGLAAGP